MKKLQIALDLLNFDRAVEICEEAVEGGVDWIEIGTPLIKSEGRKSIKEINSRFDKTIVADMKTMDTGSLEVEIATKSGADVVAILGAASDSTIKEAVRSGNEFNCKIMADLIGVRDYLERARELEDLGVDFILVHTGIDEQMAGSDPLDKLKEVESSVDLPIAVAGGIDKSKSIKAVKSGAEIIVVGGSITRSKDVMDSTKKIKKAIENASQLKGKPTKQRTRDIVEEISTANLSDAQHRKGVMKGLKRVSGSESEIFGRALTVRTISGDWAKPLEALERSEEGDILVVDAGGDEYAAWGELASNSAKIKGIKALIIDGAVRDIDEIRELDFSIWARSINPEAGKPKGYGEIGNKIQCGGVNVKTGDFILADEDGVVVVDKKDKEEMLQRAKMVKENEDRIREEIKQGKTLSEVLSLKEWEKER
ncbi:MAG: 3-hexulose-6-phosphate synthase [Candidatus Methanohalarchaeum thermophilum]|uniref:3-hexulose-6-phosphate synthase n=1 Tax=Methanohalarchaeum thermophilum TaxID=1903181 RepID=A0A1Q6DW34_METT1|nr:MAG: 3-hexulose-6-phosphate synthase [Candidatus Methanohalarchaeum thermophilum]